jgi:hypothetical protein
MEYIFLPQTNKYSEKQKIYKKCDCNYKDKSKWHANKSALNKDKKIKRICTECDGFWFM